MDFIGMFKSLAAGGGDAESNNNPLYSNWVDRNGFGGVAFLVVITAIAASVGGVITLQGSDSAANNHSDVVDITRNVYGSDSVYANTNQLTVTDDAFETYEMQYTGTKRYVRAKLTPVANTDTLSMSVVALKFRPITSTDGQH